MCSQPHTLGGLEQSACACTICRLLISLCEQIVGVVFVCVHFQTILALSKGGFLEQALCGL